MKPLALLLFLPLAALAAPEKPKKSPSPPPIPKPAGPSAVATRETAPGDIDPILRERIDSCFMFMKRGETDKAYQKLFESSDLAKDQPELMDDLVKHTARVLEKCGSVESTSILRIRSAGKTLKEISCMVSCEKRPLRYIIYAYFSKGRWQVIDTKVDAELDSFFPRE